jgi:nitroimidazol reductase NimA-like FMN-containing flavoprotein (pyridoxamine 5'-phosphate oxidase superfamily)
LHFEDGMSAQIEVLTRGQCLELLRAMRVGRVVFTESALPAVQPVTFRVHGQHVVIRVHHGVNLTAITGNAVVAFEADDLDPDLLTGWSVTVVGHANLVDDVDEVGDPSDSHSDHYVGITVEKITGLRLGRGRPRTGAHEQAFPTPSIDH